MNKQPPIETTSSDIMISYCNSFDRISASDLPQSDLTNKVVIWGLTVEGLIIQFQLHGSIVSPRSSNKPNPKPSCKKFEYNNPTILNS